MRALGAALAPYTVPFLPGDIARCRANLSPPQPPGDQTQRIGSEAQPAIALGADAGRGQDRSAAHGGGPGSRQPAIANRPGRHQSMRWRSTCLWLTLAAMVGFGLFHVSYEVQRLESKLHQLNSEILKEQRQIHVLKAEWSYLNRPERLSALASRHLDLVPMDAGHSGSIKDLPMRKPTTSPVSAPRRRNIAGATALPLIRTVGEFSLATKPVSPAWTSWLPLAGANPDTITAPGAPPGAAR